MLLGFDRGQSRVVDLVACSLKAHPACAACHLLFAAVAATRSSLCSHDVLSLGDLKNLVADDNAKPAGGAAGRVRGHAPAGDAQRGQGELA
nr:unnamed protein product [Digitaria exilis]